MNLAPPAPLTEPAVADPAQCVEPAVASMAPFCEAAQATPAPSCLDEAEAEWKPGKKPFKSSPVSVDALRKGGVEFESHAGVLQLDRLPRNNVVTVLLPCLQSPRSSISYGEIKKYILAKEGILFVYAERFDPSPLYAISLDQVEVLMRDVRRPFLNYVSVDPVPPKDSDNPHFTTVLLKHRQDQSRFYQVSFDMREAGKDVAKRFVDVVTFAPKAIQATTVGVVDELAKVSKQDEIIK